MFVLGAENMNDTLQERVGVENVSHAEASIIGNIQSTDVPDEGEACLDMESLARQYRVCGRGQRSFSVNHLLLGKSSGYRTAHKRLEVLVHSFNSVYTSLPFQSWAVSSDHYVFGMRRILI